MGGILYGAVCLLLYLFQSRLIYFPDRYLAATPQAVGLPYENIGFQTSDGVDLHGWFIPSERPASPVLLFFHGNAGNISHRLESLLIFHRLGLSTLIFDYRGYGKSEGTPSEDGTYLDAETAWGYLTQTRGVEAENVVLFGRSLGGAVAAWLATRLVPGALIVESTFTSVPDLAAKIYPVLPVRLLARFRYDAKQYIARIRCPVLIVHSHDDEIIPSSHGRALFHAAPEPKGFLQIRGGHNEGFLASGEDYVRGIGDFLTRIYSEK